MDLTQGSDVSLGEVGAEGPPTVNIIDTDSGKNIQFDDSCTLTLGRKNVESGDSDHIRCVSREHCQVSKEGTIVTLKVRNPYNPCYVWRRGTLLNARTGLIPSIVKIILNKPAYHAFAS